MQRHWIVGTVLLSAGVCHSREANKPAFRCSDLIVQLSESFAPISSFLRVPAGGTQ